jgi:hypothetical protein
LNSDDLRDEDRATLSLFDHAAPKQQRFQRPTIATRGQMCPLTANPGHSVAPDGRGDPAERPANLAQAQSDGAQDGNRLSARRASDALTW